MKKSNKGFTLIELLVVIAIIGLLSTLAVVALNSARQKSRDSKRVADIKQVQTALELYFADENEYPTEAVAVTLGGDADDVLCDDGFVAAADDCDTVYMGMVPSAPTPADCDDGNDYEYLSADGTTYTIDFCLGGTVGDLAAGAHEASPNGMQ
ncbi:MAG: type II secretion system protein [bacterium]